MKGQKETSMGDLGDSNGRCRRRRSKASLAAVPAALPGFRDYSCANSTCVLSRFEKFSMALSPDPCCPICGQSVPEHGSDSIAN
jgi:hypothetical protein